MAQLSQPSLELAQRILTEVGFEDRIRGYQLREHVGPLSLTMYSFEEVYNFLSDDFPALDFARLERWFREAFADPELADKMAEALETSTSNQERAVKTRELMGERLAQAKDIVIS